MERRVGTPVRQAAAGSPLRGVTLLVVVEDPAVRSMLVRLLSRAGAGVTATGRGDPFDARGDTGFDAVVCEGSPAALSHARALRRAHPRVPMVLLDANPDEGMVSTASIAKLDIVQHLLPALLKMLHR